MTVAPVRAGRRTVVVLGALTALGPLSQDMYLPGLPALTRQLGAPTSTGQLTLTACLLGLALGQLVAGPVSDAAGRRTPLAIGLACCVLASLGCELAPSIWALAALRFVQGAARGVGIVIARAVVRDLYGGAAAARVGRRARVRPAGRRRRPEGHVATLAATLTHAPLAVLLACLVVLVRSNGLIVPNVTALALADQRERAGSASALVGLGQLGLAAAVAPLVGIAGAGTAIPMGVAIAVSVVPAAGADLPARADDPHAGDG